MNPEVPLTNPRHEAFAQQLALGLPQHEAYVAAGYSERSARANSTRLLQTNESVRARAEYLKSQAAERAVVEATDVVNELARLAFSDVRNYATWDSFGVLLKSSSSLSDDAAAAVSEISQTMTQHGTSVKFKLHSKLTALRYLGEYLGIFKGDNDKSGALEAAKAWADALAEARAKHQADQ